MKRLTLATLGALGVLMSCQALAWIDILPGEDKTVLTILPHTHFNAWCVVKIVYKDHVTFSIKGESVVLESYSPNFSGTYAIPNSGDITTQDVSFNGVTGDTYPGSFHVDNRTTVPILGHTGILSVQCDYNNHAK